MCFRKLGRGGGVLDRCFVVGGWLVEACGELCFELAKLGRMFLKGCGQLGIQLVQVPVNLMLQIGQLAQARLKLRQLLCELG